MIIQSLLHLFTLSPTPPPKKRYWGRGVDLVEKTKISRLFEREETGRGIREGKSHDMPKFISIPLLQFLLQRGYSYKKKLMRDSKVKNFLDTDRKGGNTYRYVM